MSYDKQLSRRTLSLATVTSIVFSRSKRMSKYILKFKGTQLDWENTWMFQQGLRDIKLMDYYNINERWNEVMYEKT